MKQLIMKARSGVTLVELLVVILIVTILSVSMLPLLQPFVVESQYAAEPIPVIGNLRTKIGLYQYDKGKLPTIAVDDQGTINKAMVETWAMVDEGGSQVSGSDVSDMFKMASKDFPSSAPPLGTLTIFDATQTTEKHFASLCDIDYQELKGKRSKPNHYQYLVVQNGTDYAYFLGCFGDGNGLKTGTGYAVCEIVSPASGHKYVGTWKRYKPVGDAASQICFTHDETRPTGDDDLKHTLGCYVPEISKFSDLKNDSNGAGGLNTIDDMIDHGWEF